MPALFFYSLLRRWRWVVGGDAFFPATDSCHCGQVARRGKTLEAKPGRLFGILPESALSLGALCMVEVLSATDSLATRVYLER